MTDSVPVFTGELIVLETYRQGPRGQPGPQGPAGYSPYVFQFNFNDASPGVLITLPPDKMILRQEIDIGQGFIDPLSTIKLGIPGNAEQLLAANAIDLTEVTLWQLHNRFKTVVQTDIILTITPGPSETQGWGLIFLYIN